MSSPWTDADAILRREIASIRSDLDQLTTFDLPSLTESLTEQVTDVRGDLELLREQVEETEQKQREHEDVLEDVTANLRRIRTSVDWLERHIRASGDVETVNLDTVEKALRDAARRAEAGKAAQAQWLSDQDRRSRVAQIAVYDQATANARENARAIVSACQDLAALDWDARAHRAACTRYRTANTNWIAARHRIESTAAAAERARREVAEDDDRRVADAKAVSAGHDAWTMLTTRLRTMIAQACADGKLLPVWLATPLGPMAPAGRTERWLEVATDLLAYRITYSVTDPVLALGQMPPNAGARRSAWARKLQMDIQDLASTPL